MNPLLNWICLWDICNNTLLQNLTYILFLNYNLLNEWKMCDNVCLLLLYLNFCSTFIQIFCKSCQLFDKIPDFQVPICWGHLPKPVCHRVTFLVHPQTHPVSLTESLIGVSVLHMAMQWLVFQFYASHTRSEWHCHMFLHEILWLDVHYCNVCRLSES